MGSYILCSLQPLEYLPGDQFSSWCRVSLSPTEFPVPSISCPGQYIIHWRRSVFEVRTITSSFLTLRRIHADGTRGPASKSSVPLPPLRPPTDGLIALLHVAPVARLHEPLPLTVVVRNNHPTRTANVAVHVEFDSTDAFVIAGLRNGRLPLLLPGGEEKVLWNLIPIECGHVSLPKIKVINRRQANPESDGEAEVVRIIDVRLDVSRQEEGEEQEAGSEVMPEHSASKDIIGTILVTP